MISKIEYAVKRYGLFENVKEITVALSGGADSVSLLHSLNSLKGVYGFELFAAHYHHGIRGAEADRDLDFCIKLCKSLDITLFYEKGNVPEYAHSNGISLETAARKLRYDFLNRVSKGVIATAHTASDNTETVLFNLSRGASASGLKGIPPKRDNIIRPLIFCKREDVEKYVKDNGLEYVTDSTNLSDDCSRNIIRHKIVPVLKEINTGVEDNCSKLSVLLGEDKDFIDFCVKEEYEKRRTDKGLDIKGFGKLFPAIKKRLIILFYKEFFGSSPDFYHTEGISDVCIGKKQGLSLINGYYAVKENGFLIFTNSLTVNNTDFSVNTVNMGIEEYKKQFFDKKITSSFKVHKLFLKSSLDYDKIVGTLIRTAKNSSDTLKLANSNSTKSLKKLITEKKIPLNYRKNLPVFCDDKGIVWVYGLGCADRVKIDEETKNVVWFDVSVKGEENYEFE